MGSLTGRNFYSFWPFGQEKFGKWIDEEKLWQICSFWLFNEQRFGEWIDSAKRLQLLVLIWMALVWLIMDDLSNSPNFLAIWYMFYTHHVCTYTLHVCRLRSTANYSLMIVDCQLFTMRITIWNSCHIQWISFSQWHQTSQQKCTTLYSKVCHDYYYACMYRYVCM